MRHSLLTAVAAAAGLLHAGHASGSTWTPPDNVRIVQKVGRDSTNVLVSTGAIDTQIQAAITALSGSGLCSAATHCTVKVMPGVYDLGTATLSMKRWVDVVGSGREATTITSMVDDPSSSCAAGTVIMADETAISDLQVINTGWNQTVTQMTAALVFWNTATGARAENMIIKAGSLTGAGTSFEETVCAGGTTATISINNSTILGYDSLPGSNSCDVFHDYSVDGARFSLTNSTGYVEQAHPDAFIHVMNCNNPGTVTTIVNSWLEGRGGSNIVFAQGGTLNYLNSTFVAAGGPCGMSAEAATFVNTRFVCNATSGYWPNAANTRIANSQLPGDRSGLVGATLVGNYDENFMPIANTYAPVP